MNSDRYKDIIKLPLQYRPIKIVTHLPTPTDFDYTTGYITRYFLQKANDVNSAIYEVKQSAIMKYNSNSFYNIVTLDWRLTGTREQIKESNSASLRFVSDKMPKIALYLPNLLQFSKV